MELDEVDKEFKSAQNNLNILPLGGQYTPMPKYPSASLTIGVVLKNLIDKGLLEYGENGQCFLTSLGYTLFKKDSIGHNLKIDFTE